MLILVVYSLAMLISVPLGIAVYLQNPKNSLNRSFLLFTIFATFWLSGVLLEYTPDSIFLTHFRLLFVFALAMVTAMNVFIRKLTDRHIVVHRSYLAVTAVAMVVSLTPYVTESVLINRSDGFTLEPSRGFAYPLLISWILFLVCESLYFLYRAMRYDAEKRQQLAVVLTAFLAATLFTVTTNVVLPNIVGNVAFNDLSPLALVLLSSMIAYAVMRHGFLDIRAIVARSVAYTMILGSIALLYFLGVIGLSNRFVLDQSLSFGAQMYFLFIAVLLAVSIFTIKRFFDKITRRIFYRDAYDTQDAINQLSTTLANELDLDSIMVTTNSLIGSTIQPEFAQFVVYEEGGKQKMQFFQKPIHGEFAYADVQSFSASLILADDTNTVANRFMRKQQASAVLVLHESGEVIGALVVGKKQNGSILTNQDINLLGIISNELEIAVQNARNFDRIQEFNMTLQKRIDDATGELRRSNEKLKALDEAKDEFVSMASHQLRTPLTSIKGYISMVMEGDVGKISDKQYELLSAAFQSSQRMVYLISDLLNASRLRTGKFIIEKREMDMPSIVEAEIAQVSDTATSRQLKIHFDAPKEFPPVFLDENKTRQVMMNFLDNAIYYTRAGGDIYVTLKANKKQIEYSVTDSGIGVPKADQHKLFEKFYRAGNARAARPDGTGLGLFMAKKVIVAQGGAIIFKSKEGVGSTFGFTFPISATKPADSAKVAKSKKPLKSVAKPTVKSTSEKATKTTKKTAKSKKSTKKSK